MKRLNILYWMRREKEKKMAIYIEFKRISGLFFKDFCKNCTLHGVRYFTVRVRHWSERLWWMMAIGLSLWLSTLMIQSFWLEWQNHPMKMITTNEVNPVSKTPFPTVIICPETKIVRDKFDLLSKFDSKNHLLPNITETEKMRLSNLALICPGLANVIPHKSNFADEEMFNVIEDLAPTVEQITLSCSWKGTIINCSDYLKPVLTHNGLCFTFNGLKSRDIYTNEMAPGAIIAMGNPNVSHWSLESGYEREFGKDEYPIRVTDSDQITTLEINLVIHKHNDNRLCLTTSQGFSVLLTSPHEPNTLVYGSIEAALSEDTHIYFTPKRITTSNGLRKYAPNQRQCFYQSERQLRFFKTYSRSNCYMECWANLTKQVCGCVQFSMPRDRDTKICGSSKSFCFYETLDKTSSIGFECNCLPACTSTEYTTKIERFRLNPIGGKQLNESQRQARLRVTLQNAQVKTMERVETVTISDFLAMCGGVLGLFMGFSALSFIELIYYPFLRLFWMIRRMKEENDKKQSDPNETSKDNENRAHSKKRTSRLRRFLLEYCDNSNIHGLRYFSEQNLDWIERCYWAIGCVVSLSLCIWMTYNIWVQWQLSPVLIKPTENISIRSTVPLPTVTICPEIKTMKQKLDLTSAINNLSNLPDIEVQRLNALANVCPLLPHSVAFEDKFANESLYDTIQNIAPQFEDTLQNCVWNGQFPFRSCSTRMTPILTDEGLCFAYNALNWHGMYTNEMAPGMMMVTDNPNVSHWSLENGYDFGIHKDEYPTRLTKESGFTHSFISLLIDKRNFDHQCNHFDGGFKLTLTPPGEVLKMSRNYIRIQLKKINAINFESKVTKSSEGLRSYTPNQRQCFFQSDRRLRFFKMYTEANCEEECLANFTSVECGCVHFSMPRDNKTKICGGSSVLCLKAAEKKLLTDKSVSAFHSECNCLPACVSIEYNGDINQRFTIVYNSSEFLTLKDQREEMAVVTLKFQNVDTLERVERFTVIDFLAFCGGLLGMFLGISVLSLVEIVYFITIRLFWAIRQWKSENSVAPSEHESFEMVTIENHDE